MRLLNELSSTIRDPAQWLLEWFRGGPESASGAQVDVSSTLGFPAVWYAVARIAGDIGKTPINVRRRVERGSVIADMHPVHALLNHRPSELMPPIIFKETMMVHALLQGNGRAAILRRGGVPHELIMLMPHQTTTCMVEGKKWHVVHAGDRDERIVNSGPITPSTFRDGMWLKIPDEDVLHVPGLGYNGLFGKSLISVAKDALGLGLAAQKASSYAFRNGSKPGIIIEAPEGMFRDEDDAKEFVKNIDNYQAGVEKTGRTALIREGMKVQTLSMSASDAEWVAQRQFQRQEIALLFGIEAMPGDEDSFDSSLERRNLAYVQNCLQRWICKWEEECNFKLLGKRAQRTHFTQFEIDKLLKTDLRSRLESYSIGINARIYNPNECRELEGLLPYPEGDEYANPAITPGQGGDTEDDDEEEEAPKEDAKVTPTDAQRLSVQSRIEQLLKVEANHVVRASKFAPNKNYLQWLDTFYTGKWQNTMIEAIVAIGGSDTMATTHCEQSHAELIEMTGVVYPDGLADAVTEVVASWPQRAEHLTNQLLELTNV